MAGLPGSGKSTLALAIGRRLGWPVLDKDTVKSGLLGLGATEELSSQASYVLLYDLARDLVVRKRLAAILDTPAFYPRTIDVAIEVMRECEGRLKVILCLAGLETRMRRLAERERQVSQPGPYDDRSYRDVAGDGSEYFGHLPENTLRIDTEQDMESIVGRAVAYVLSGA